MALHTYYRQRGGEDKVFESETDLMESYGWTVHRVIARNSDIDSRNFLRVSRNTIWNNDWYKRIQSEIETFKPDVVHIHNTFPAISPAAIWACKQAGVPVVQTLHNYRLGCLNGFFFRDGHDCTECLGRAPLPGVLHGCYRSIPASAVLATSTCYHRHLGTYSELVDRFVALSNYAKSLFVKIGIHPDKIEVKPNGLFPQPNFISGEGDYCLFLGRLSSEKGIATLSRAWSANPDLPMLMIAGEGPNGALLDCVRDRPNVSICGLQSTEGVANLLGKARCLIMPSEWNEVCPMAMVESLGTGIPIIMSDVESLSEFYKDTDGILTFPRGDADALAQVVRANYNRISEKRMEARRTFEKHFSSDVAISKLDQIYSDL